MVYAFDFESGGREVGTLRANNFIEKIIGYAYLGGMMLMVSLMILS